jgi:hypothetical protein
MRKVAVIFVVAVLMVGVACTKHDPGPRLVVEIPAGFSGNFVLEMGNRDAAPLSKQGEAYVVTVARSGKLATSTILQKPKVEFRNATDGSIWGYSQSVFTTGDGIAVGGKIEFFVGTRKDYDAEENKKNHSGTSMDLNEYVLTGA